MCVKFHFQTLRTLMALDGQMNCSLEKKQRAQLSHYSFNLSETCKVAFTYLCYMYVKFGLKTLDTLRDMVPNGQTWDGLKHAHMDGRTTPKQYLPAFDEE